MMMKMLMSDNELRYQMSDNELRPLQVLLERLWGSLGSLSGASRRGSKPPQNLSQNPLYIRHLYFTVGAPARETSPLKWASPEMRYQTSANELRYHTMMGDDDEDDDDDDYVW